jgi:hypothetical protein
MLTGIIKKESFTQDSHNYYGEDTKLLIGEFIPLTTKLIFGGTVSHTLFMVDIAKSGI